MLGLLFESVPIGGKHLVSVKPPDDVALLFAIKPVGQTGGPDRRPDRSIAPAIRGVIVAGIDHLIA